MEYKALPTFTKSIDDRTVVGVFAVHGNVDSGGDRSHPGSFSKTLESLARIKSLWQHDMFAPPIAKVDSLRELSRDDLPSAVLAKAPDATGGVEVVRTYLDTPRGEEILTGIKAGAITEMSYAYDAIKFDFEELDGKSIRNLREVRLYEVSDVNWGMNEATVGAKSSNALVLERLAAMLEAAQKSGARHSAADVELLNQIALNAHALGATNVKLFDADKEPDKAAALSALPDMSTLKRQLDAFRLSATSALYSRS